MRPVTLAYLYLRRLRTHPVQELLAGAGIAIGVALTFAVQVANHSVTGSAEKTAQELSGAAALELIARSTHGVDEGLVRRVRQLPGVRRATGVLEQNAVLSRPEKQLVAVHVAGADFGRTELAGVLHGSLSIGGLDLREGVVVPERVAAQLGIPSEGPRPGEPRARVSLRVRGRAAPVRITAVVTHRRFGAFADGPTIVMRRSQLQRIARLPHRITRVLVQVAPGQEASVRRRLTTLSAGRLMVGTPQDDLELLKQATAPGDRATAFFTMIAVLVGWLLAFNAMLLSAPERRRVTAELRIQGFTNGQLIQLALFQAALLGIVASLAGLAAGQVLAQGVLHESATYLTGAFTFGTETVVPRSALVLSFVGGIAATCLAAAPPLLVLRRHDDPAGTNRAAETGGPISATVQRRLAGGSLVLLLTTGVLLSFSAATTIVALVGLALALLLAIPALFATAVRVAEAGSARASRLTMPALALLLLRAGVLRSLALAATGALAVFGSVAVGSARNDLMRGIERFSEHYANAADLWIVHPVDDQTTKDFPAAGLTRRVARIPGVAGVQPYRGGYLDLAGRRVWVIAHPARDPEPVAPAEIVNGNADRVAARLRQGGWITMSKELARTLGIGPGDTVRLPTPTGPARFRIAATTTNFGWSAGAIVLGESDYQQAWASTDPTALEVALRPGAPRDATAAAVRAALGPRSALEVQTADQRADQANASARAGLARLGQIAALLLLGAALAMAAAMSAAIWQRRPALAALRLQGLRPSQLWGVLLSEAAVVLVSGCLSGALAGIYGQFLIDRYLRLTTGFAAPFTPAGWPAIAAFLLLVAMGLAGVAVPGYLAARTPARLGLQD